MLLLIACLHSADARKKRSKRRSLWGGQSSKGSGEMQGRKRTSDLARWGRGGRGRYRFSLLFFFFFLFLPRFLTSLLFLSAISTSRLFCFAVSCAAGMQASQATIVAVSLQPFAHTTQFQHTNINRAGIFRLTSGSVVQVLRFRPGYSPISRQQSISHFSFHSVAPFFSGSVDGLAFSPYLRAKLWQALSEREAKKGPSLKLQTYESKSATEAGIQQILLVWKDIFLTLLIYPRAENWRQSGSGASLCTKMNAPQCRWLRCKHAHLILVNDSFPPLS